MKVRRDDGFFWCLPFGVCDLLAMIIIVKVYVVTVRVRLDCRSCVVALICDLGCGRRACLCVAFLVCLRVSFVLLSAGMLCFLCFADVVAGCLLMSRRLS